MNISRKERKILKNAIIVLVGICIMTGVMFVTGNRAYNYAKDITVSTVDTLKHQCVSFNNIKTVDRTKSLFVLYENILELNKSLKRNAALVDDDYLEGYVDEIRVTGVALLDENLELEASGYTRNLRRANWQDEFYPGCFEEMLEHKEKVLLERIKSDEQYYDVCAMARRDKKGVVIAYYKQPMNLLQDTETDLSRLLDGTYMELDGDFIIEHDGHIVSKARQNINSKSFVLQASTVFREKGLNTLRYANTWYLGTQSVVDGYDIYVFCPVASVFHNVWTAVIISALVYAGLWLVVSFMRTRSIRDKQRSLEEANERLTETVNSLQSLKSIYFTIFQVNLKTEIYKSVFTAPWIAEIVPDKGKFSDGAKALCDSFVMEKYREEILEHLDFDHIKRQLKEENLTDVRRSYYIDFESERDGETRWVCLTVTAMDYDVDGNPINILVMLHDITNEKRKEMQYQQRILEESEAAQVATKSKSAFLFNMSHDLKTPMNAILGYTDLARKYKNNPEKLEQYMDNIHISGERMLVLINEILEVARIENNQITVNFKAARSGEITDNCVMMLTPVIDGKKQEFTLTKNILHPYVITDYSHMLQVMLNLLGNAVKFTPNGGKISLVLNQSPCNEDGMFTTEIIVSDSGIGISKEFLPHIFDNFARENTPDVKKTSGSGLGLGIVKTLVELLNGTIEVESEKGKGSTFTVRVPSRVATGEDVAEEAVEESVVEKSTSRRVLLTEDNVLNAEIATELISERGFEVDWARDGYECIKKLEKAPYKHYGLILMDIQMPGIDGYETTREIRKMKKSKKGNIPIVAMTANAFPEDKMRAFECGMNDHIAKPIDIYELMRVLKKFVV